jgi:hypothetical protein
VRFFLYVLGRQLLGVELHLGPTEPEPAGPAEQTVAHRHAGDFPLGFRTEGEPHTSTPHEARHR